MLLRKKKEKDMQESMLDMTSEGFVKRQKAAQDAANRINDKIVARYKNYSLTHFDYTQLGPNKWMTAISVDVALNYFLNSYLLDEKYRESIQLFTTEMYNTHKRLFELNKSNAAPPSDDFLYLTIILKVFLFLTKNIYSSQSTRETIISLCMPLFRIKTRKYIRFY